MGLEVMKVNYPSWMIPGQVKIDENMIELKPKLPHKGWNTIKDIQNHELFKI